MGVTEEKEKEESGEEGKKIGERKRRGEYDARGGKAGDARLGKRESSPESRVSLDERSVDLESLLGILDGLLVISDGGVGGGSVL